MDLSFKKLIIFGCLNSHLRPSSRGILLVLLLQCHIDHTIFFKSYYSKITVAIYVDETIVDSNDEKDFQDLKQFLNEAFDIEDLGTLNYLGIEVA